MHRELAELMKHRHDVVMLWSLIDQAGSSVLHPLQFLHLLRRKRGKHYVAEVQLGQASQQLPESATCRYDSNVSKMDKA